ncbi:MAG: citrate synthase [Curvibacter lanceolatus]|uniref:citrate synthase n=1 Tax=Curvibacter lanceolatus TaxID=86182 RepID=UPI0023570CEB|nr:citrate synthase [Curvibacter lanceolatus]MBV5296158.1 citrate synthase [Curvibacter lanceolatus]
MGWITAEQALHVLQVRPQTLYAQVSRHAIRSRPDPADPRRSLYHAQDVQQQAARRAGRRRDQAIAAATIRWGDPVLDTGLSTVSQGRLCFRGRDAVTWSHSATLEEVAELLWQARPAWPPATTPHRPCRPAPAAPALTRALQALAERAAHDPATLGAQADTLAPQAASVLMTVAEALIGDTPAPAPGHPLHLRLARQWGCPQAAELIRQALVLLADHELNASTFATRVTASTGAALSACVLSGLATLSGPLHGGAVARVQALVDTALAHGAEAALAPALQSGRLYPAFGHPLYPEGDVRAQALLASLMAASGRLPPGFAELQALALQRAGEHPTVDFALAALARHHGWPADGPFTVFALSRCVGWLAHAIEQVQQGALIRPRARYVGPPLVKSPEASEPRDTDPKPRPVSRWHP